MKRVRIVEVGPRDGLQNEKTPLSAAAKVAFIDLLSASGLTTIESGAFVSAKKVPQMADTDKVYRAIRKKPGVSYPVLVPNMHGMEDALKAGVTEVAVFAAASETFSRKNIDCSISESFERFRPVLAAAKANGVKVRGYVSCVLGCPYEGEIKPEAVVHVTKTLLEMGCYEVSLGDTIGVGKPEQTRSLMQAVKAAGIPIEKIAGHFHDTHHRALDNIRAAMEEGVAVFDSSASGLGGCPYAPGASGNVATEAVVDMLHGMGIETGVDREKLGEAGRFISTYTLRPAAPGPWRDIAARLRPFFIFFMLLQSGLRLALLAGNWAVADHAPRAVAGVLVFGLLRDLVAFLAFAVPVWLQWWLVPRRLKGQGADRAFAAALFFLMTWVWFFVLAAEWTFWMEFGRRFSSIVFDYLPYWDEVSANLRESYPLALILCGITGTAALATALMRPWRLPPPAKSGFGERTTLVILVLCLVAGLGQGALNLAIGAVAGNPFATRLRSLAEDVELNHVSLEIANSGYLQLVRHYKSSLLTERNFADVFATVPDSGAVLRRELAPESAFLSEDTTDIARHVKGRGAPVTPNVIFVTMEGMDAANMAFFGNKDGLTPRLDALAEQSLFFTDLYATAFGTVFGLESLTLSSPALPTRSLVTLKDSGRLHTLGDIFRGKGYDTAFFYGGYAYFDNMRGFYEANGYRVLDRGNFTASFANGWGVDDESEFAAVLSEADTAAAAGKKFFFHVMTMSNHTPYTYPGGRIDIASGAARGAVKYADYAIGAFLDAARQKPWFDDTIFVFVADHCAAGAGFGRGTEGWPGYHIPALIYGPKFIKPTKITQMTSQIDLAPTLLGQLGWDYVSRFIGKDAVRETVGRAMFWINADLVFITQDGGAILLQADTKRVLESRNGQRVEGTDPLKAARAIAYFQQAAAWRQYLRQKNPE